VTDDTTTQNLSITTKTISIKVIQIDGHKMTKATFDQIPIQNKEKDIEDYDNIELLGWVNDNRLNKKNSIYDKFWVLYVDDLDNELKKCFCYKPNIKLITDQLYIAT